MIGERDNGHRVKEGSSVVRRHADELDLTTDYEVAVNTTVREYGNARGIGHRLPAGTHFLLTDADGYRVMWADNDMVISIRNRQIIPIKRPDKEWVTLGK